MTLKPILNWHEHFENPAIDSFDKLQTALAEHIAT